MAYKIFASILLVLSILKGDAEECMPDFFEELEEPATYSFIAPFFDLGEFLENSPEIHEQFEELSDADKAQLFEIVELLTKAFITEMKEELSQ